MGNSKIKQVLAKKSAVWIGIFVSLVILGLGYFFIDRQELTVNLSPAYATIEIISHIFLSLGLGFLIAVIVAKPNYKKTSGIIGTIGGIFGVLITGCPVCGVTLMSMLGLVGALSFLPRFGLEIKIFSILMILWSIDYSLRWFDACSPKFWKGLFPSWQKTITWILIFVGIFFGTHFLLKQAERIKVPEYELKFLFPSNYSAYRYDLTEGCSDVDQFWEFFGQERNPMLKNLKIYSLQTAENFDSCEQNDEYALGEIDLNNYQNFIDKRSTETEKTIESLGLKFVFKEKIGDLGEDMLQVWTVINQKIIAFEFKYYDLSEEKLWEKIQIELENFEIREL